MPYVMMAIVLLGVTLFLLYYAWLYIAFIVAATAFFLSFEHYVYEMPKVHQVCACAFLAVLTGAVAYHFQVVGYVTLALAACALLIIGYGSYRADRKRAA